MENSSVNSHVEPLSEQLEQLERMQLHKENFENFVKSIVEKEDNNSILITREKYQQIVSYLDGTISNPDPAKKHYFRKQQYKLQEENGKTVLYRQFSKRENTVNLQVAVVDDFFEILYQLHSIQRGHIGINKIESQIAHRYYGIPRAIIATFIKFCPICNLKSIQMGQDRVKPIRSEDFLARFQIDLVDMRHRPCEYYGKIYKWIAHVMDHFTKFNVLWALVNKCADDNGKEFKNVLMLSLIESWDGNCKIIHGRPRHPQSQGLVEQGNGTLERMIASMMTQFNTNN
ncbi:unnamed protein product [Brachionus calyciflorus]|uniref:Integrase catalytic domain-containing protein n=1 Tax=Brachionus calyciflorus TaxID=104777 RepID=A0A814RTN9_9BILA|nr:unnamed protein product [Brachionus calyciflorus]